MKTWCERNLSNDTLMLMDFQKRLTDTGIKLSEIGEDIEEIFITVLTGDEIATVTFADGHEEIFDSSNNRLADFDDGFYTLYRKGEVNQLDKFLGRDSSYWDWEGE